MKNNNQNKLDPYVTIEGSTLISHFNFMDKLIWNSLYIIAQKDPKYLQDKVASLILKYVSGYSAGRHFFIEKSNKKLMGSFLENLRVWILTNDTLKFLKNLKKFKLYRDTLREWAIDYKGNNSRYGKQLLIWKNSYFRIREQLTISYLPIVIAMASRYGLTEDQRSDLYQIGSTGLIHAIERYNNLNSINFHKFARQWIRQKILMSITRHMPLIRVSHSILEAQSKLTRQERVTGEKDQSIKAQRIRRMVATKDVVLLESPDAATQESGKEELSVDIDMLPGELKKVLIVNHELIDYAKCPYSIKQLQTEASRQVKSYFSRKGK